MDKYDPNKNVALVVDEWGIWTECEPDTNPGFLYQQNSLRDALLAAVNFDIFNKHSDRVKMTNIAQTVNVLQSVALTEGEKMILTPTYHAYRMYTAHHDAKFLPAYFESPDFELDDQKIPAVSVTASQPQSSREINITLTNLDTVKSQEFEIELRGNDGIKSAASEILTADSVTSHNTFEKTDTVKTQSYDGFVLKDGKLTVKLAPKSLTSLKIQ